MTQSNSFQKGMSDLRNRGEKRVCESLSTMQAVSSLTREEMEGLLHELQGRQIELEVQSEELRRAQTELESLKDKYLDLYDFAPAGYVTIGETGLILEANLTACRLLGIERKSLIDSPFVCCVYPTDRDKYYSSRRELFQARTEQACDLQLLRKNGETFHAHVIAALTPHTESEVHCTRMIITDNTEGKQGEVSLRESENRFRKVMEDVSGIPVQGYDQQRRVVFWNSASEKVYGYTREEALGKRLEDLIIPPEMRQNVITAVDNWITHGERIPAAELGLMRKDGSTVPVYSCHVMLENARGEKEMFCVDADLTELKKAERERAQFRDQLWKAQKFEAIGTLTGGIAHDFNNLLTIVNGFAEIILLDTDKDDPRYEDLRNILETGRKGGELVQRLLALSKEGKCCPQPLDLNLLIRESVSLLDRTFPKMIEIETMLGPDLDKVNADAVQVQQCIMNLCINAKEAMPGGGRLAVEARNVLLDENACRLQPNAKSGRYVTVKVSDTGNGMSPEIQERIFDPFFTTKGWDFNKGTGLGLSVVKGIVEQHDGWITCESEPGIGSTFRVYFPSIQSPHSGGGSASSDLSTKKKERILVVDDEVLVRDLAKRMLERAGYKVVTAADGEEALKIYAKESADIGLVVLDLIMPHMGGEKCLKALLRINPNLKVVISSGQSFSRNEKEILGGRAKGFVNKPYHLNEFLEVVRRTLEEE